MPEGFVHASVSLLAFGRSYFTEHQRKDAPYAVLGREHRSVNHDWYHACGTLWDFDCPNPDWLAIQTAQLADNYGDEEAEIYQAGFLNHDFVDRLEDRSSRIERKVYAVRCIFLLWHPEIMESKFGVDVIKGRIHRLIDGQDVWEERPETVRDYERLLRYVEEVLRNGTPRCRTCSPGLSGVIGRCCERADLRISHQPRAERTPEPTTARSLVARPTASNSVALRTPIDGTSLGLRYARFISVSWAGRAGACLAVACCAAPSTAPRTAALIPSLHSRNRHKADILVIICS